VQHETNQFEDLKDDLVYLRKDAGFTAARVGNASAFLQVIGGSAQTYENMKLRFISAVQSLDRKQAGVLLAAYGLADGYNQTLLKDRRAKYAQSLGLGIDSIMDRENAAISELALRLLSALYTGAPLPATYPMPHGSYLLEHLYIDTIIKDRKFVEHTHERRVISLIESAPYFEYHSSYQTKIIPISGMTIETERHVNGDVHRCIFPKPLKRGEVHTFSFKQVLVEPDEYPDLKQDSAGSQFPTPAYLYRQTVTFIGEKPRVCWFYNKMTDIVRPGRPSANNMLVINDEGIVSHEFTQQYGGFWSGIVWEW
jgi:hypothetical protein